MDTLSAQFNPRENNFDLIRIVAALVVVYSHSYALAKKEYDPPSSFLHAYPVDADTHQGKRRPSWQGWTSTSATIWLFPVAA